MNAAQIHFLFSGRRRLSRDMDRLRTPPQCGYALRRRTIRARTTASADVAVYIVKAFR